MYNEQKSLPYEKNWANNIDSLLLRYGLHNEKAQDLSKMVWKDKVKRSITKKAFESLTKEAKEKMKTKLLQYQSLSIQPYLLHYHPKQASTIFKLRSRSIECKVNRKSTAANLICRLCKENEESQDHVVNCRNIRLEGAIHSMEEIIGEVPLNNENVHEICNRFYEFNKQINEINTI